jgi:hypothetical protein
VIHENIEAFATSLVAFSTELDPNEARELVAVGRAFLNETMTVKRLHDIIFDKEGAKLRTSPEGESVSSWQIVVGDTELFAKTDTKVTFQTTVLVYSQAERPVRSLPFVQITNVGQNSPLTTISTSTGIIPSSIAGTVTIPSSTISVSETLSAGAVFGTISPIKPSSIGISSATNGGVSVLTNIAEHAFSIRWSATLCDHKLGEFELIAVKHESAVWE